MSLSRKYAVALVLLSTVGFGSMAMFAKIAYASGITPTMLLALRFALAAAILAPVVWLKRTPLPRGRVLAGFGLMGALYTAQSQCYFTALMHASSGLVALLLYVYPVLVTILAMLFGWEKLNRRTFVLLAIAVGGLAITLGGNLEGEPLGVLLGLLAAGVYAVYILIGGRLTLGTDPLAATLIVLMAAALGNGTLALASGAALPSGTSTWLAILAIALFSTVIAIAAFLAGVKHVGPARASIISTMEPVITIGLGVALLGESVSVGQLVGGAMVLTAVVLLAQRPRQDLPAQAGQAAA
ncbi:MAG TPA: DMT family transporter [Noviherbaspirillum sp.]